jgi:hypothetical protein
MRFPYRVTIMDKLFKELDEWLKVLDKQVISLRTNQHIFWEVQKIIRGNPKIDKPNDFYGWMAEMYAHAMSVAIRKMIDKNRSTISFQKFLEKLKANPSVISRSRYKHQFVDYNYMERDADEGFDQIVGIGRDHLDPALVTQQLETLENKTAKLRDFVNKRIAHHEKSEFNDLPTFKELDEAIACLEDLLKFYLPLFTGLGLDSALPKWLYDWKEVFYCAWIEQAQE